MSFQPSALAFPAVPVNASITRSVTITNNGSSPATIPRMSIGGPSRHDFSVLAPGILDAACRGGRASHPAAQTPPCHRRVPHARACTITVVFTPSAPGPRTADLEIYFASRPQPQEIALTGTGIRTLVITPSTPPILTLAPDQTVEATGPDGAPATYTVSASDAQDGTLTPSCSPASGSVFPLGTTTVNCSVTDSGGLTATGSFTVAVGVR
jgi:Cep192 domain 4/HYR domain